MPDQNGTDLQVKEIFSEEDSPAFGGAAFIAHLSAAGEFIPAWWSLSRDIELRRFWKKSDHIAGTVSTLRDMMTAIPLKVIPRDGTVKAHRRQALEMTFNLRNRTESRGNFTNMGWSAGFGAFVEDYHTQDNGSVFVVEGPGRGDKPLSGPPVKLIHLDSARCWRTQSREFPIIYTDMDGKQFKLHSSRVIGIASQASPVGEMFGVGFCAVSRCINVGQNLIDISRYKQEKLGSRPYRGFVAVESSAGAEREAKAISLALRQAGESMDNQGLQRFAKLPVVSVRGTVSLVDMASLPDGYNELESTQLGMAVLALAFGVDVRQLAFALGVAGQTKADAEIQHLKMRGKGPGTLLAQVKQQIDLKFLPPHLELIFDFQDDAQDQMRANIRKTRADRREKDLAQGVTDTRVEREQMVEDGEITEAQFIQLELDSGNLPDGESVEVLFQIKDPIIQSWLTIEPIELAIETVQEVLANEARAAVKNRAKLALAALEGKQNEQTEISEAVREIANGSKPDGDSNSGEDDEE